MERYWTSCDGVKYTDSKSLAFKSRAYYTKEDFLCWLGNQIDYLITDEKGYHAEDNGVKISYRDFPDFLSALERLGYVKDIILINEV